MAEMTANQMFAKLVSLRDSTGEKHYERIALADKLLKDREWVEAPSGGGGDENTALDRLEEECFADLCGLVSLPQLLEVYHHVPEVEKWRRNKFNLKKIWADWKAKQQPQRRTEQTTTAQRATRELVPPTSFPELTPAQSRKEYEKAFRSVETSAEKIARLEQENAELKAENASLKERIQRLTQGVRNVLAG